MKKPNYNRFNEENPGGSAFIIPARLVEHRNFIRLSAWATKLIFDLSRQFVPQSNGYLHPGIKLLSNYGWSTRRTLFLAIRELMHYGVLLQTVQGGKNAPSYYAFSFKALGKERKDRPWQISQTWDGKPPHHLWQREVEDFAPPPLGRRNKKSLVLAKNKPSSSREQVKPECVLRKNKRAMTCSSEEQVKPEQRGGFVLPENSYASMPAQGGGNAGICAAAVAGGTAEKDENL